MGFESLDSVVAKLELYATNTESYIRPIMRTLSKKHRAGIFDYERALHAVERYCLVPAAKQYKREFGSMTDSWSGMFPKAIREQAAKNIVDHALVEFRLGNYWA